MNGPFGDPCVFVSIMREKRAFLFDLGDMGGLGAGNLMKVSDIFVSHMHMDHFIGFDIILRTVLRKETPLNIYGPENIIRCVEGKLGGYTWNLIRDYFLKVEVFEVGGGLMRHAGFYAENSFRGIEHPARPFDGTVAQDPFFTVKGIALSHQIPVMAYSLEEEYHININKAALEDRGLPAGPWLSDLKRAIRGGLQDNTIFNVAGTTLELGELKAIVSITRGQKVSYITDIAPTEENMEKVIPFVRGSDLLFCEAYFLSRDIDRARERHHLTAAQAGGIAREAGVGALELQHFSPKYRDCADEVYAEAMKEFRGE